LAPILLRTASVAVADLGIDQGFSMRKRYIALAAAVSTIVVITGAAALASDTMLDPFTQTELDDNWEADREFPTDGVTSVSFEGRDDVARIGINSSETHTNTFRRTEGIKTVGNFGDAVQVDLYLDPDWKDQAVRAGFWVVGDDGEGNRDDLFGIIEFVNLEPSTSGESAQGEHEGWRFWTSAEGWTEVDDGFTYGQWATLLITLEDGTYHFSVDGEDIGQGPGGEHFIGEVFLNSYNYGLDGFPNLDNGSYAAHWHAGLVQVDEKDECRDGAWEDAGFQNQGQCIRFVNTGKDSR
jgi:hypothetical protein